MMPISFSIVKDTFIKKGFKVLKLIQHGAKTADVASDFGEDSTPLKDMVAIYAQTEVSGDSVVVGYLNKNHITKEGEKRIYSMDPQTKQVSIDIILRTDGTLELGGSQYTSVRFAPLNTELVEAINKLNQELVKIQTGISTAGGSYTPSPINLNLSGAESSNIKIE